MLPAVFEFAANESDAVEVGAHSELLVFDLWLAAAGAALRKRLVVECQGENNVAPYLSSVQYAVEAPKLHRVVPGEKAMQVEEVVSALVVVGVAAVAIPGVPDFLDLLKGARLGFVHPAHHVLIHLLAVPHPAWFYLQGFVEKVVFAGDDVDEVSDAPGRVRRTVKVDMNPRAVIGKAASFAQPADELLQGVDVFAVGKNGADQLDAVFVVCGDPLPVLAALAGDASVAHEFPLSAVRCGNCVRVVGIGAGAQGNSKVFCCSLCGLSPCDPRKFYFDPKPVAKHCFCPFQRVFAFRMYINHSDGDE